jgi:hypothetical protein
MEKATKRPGVEADVRFKTGATRERVIVDREKLIHLIRTASAVCRVHNDERVMMTMEAIGAVERDVDWSFESNAPADLPAVAGKVRRDVGCLDDATKGKISMRGQALLQWGSQSNGFAAHSVQMPENVVDQILIWRDQSLAPNADLTGKQKPGKGVEL